MNNISEILKNADLKAFKPVPFWSINSKLERDEIERQISEMKNFGLGGFIFHARAGLETPYLSDEWFDMVKVALEKAKELGLKVWLYDEYGWPSGFVGGKLLKDEKNRAGFLRYEVKPYFDDSAFAVFVRRGDDFVRTEAAVSGEKEYHTINKLLSDAYCDILNPHVTDLFISETHEKYYARFKNSFGKELAGFFTDEPQYYRYETPISSVCEEEYRKAYGENLKDGLIRLFVQNEKGYPFRVKYYNLLNKLYCENYYKRLYDWCDSHGILLTGHSVEETFFFTQMWGGADCATSYLYEHIPAIDNLARDGTAEISAKSIGSVAAQTGKKLVLTETFGCSGYGVTPKELKLIADKQYVYGVDLMCQHLYNYTFSKLGKIDCPPSFGRIMPWKSFYKSFNDYFSKLGYMIANSEEKTEVAVVTPMESIYLDYLRLSEDKSRTEVDVPFIGLLSELKKRGVSYHFINEKIAEKLGRVENGKLIIGEKSYSQVVLNPAKEMKSSTLSLLKEFSAEGGEIFGKTLPEFIDGKRAEVTLPLVSDFDKLKKPTEITFDGEPSYSYRTIDGREFVFVVNESEKPVTMTTKEKFSAYDPTIGEAGEYHGGKTENIIPARSGMIFELGDIGNSEDLSLFSAIVPEYVSADENTLVVDNVTVKTENGRTFEGYFHGVYERLVKSGFCGKAEVFFKFISDGNYPAKLIIEKQKTGYKSFNGEKLNFKQSENDIGYEYSDINIKKGENVLSYTIDFEDGERVGKILYDPTVPESLRNCIAYETGIEQIFVRGDFDCENGKIVAKKRKVAGNLTSQGLENFFGKAVYTFDYDFDGTPVRFAPKGDFTACALTIDGKNYEVLLTDGVTVRGVSGKKTVKVECYSSLRNAFGPFYYRGKEESGVGSDAFTLRGGWNDDGTNKNYDGQKRLIPFGIKDISVLR